MKERDSKRLSEKIYDPPTIQNLEHIKAAIAKLDAGKTDVTVDLVAQLEAPDGNSYEVVNPTKSYSMHRTLVEGFAAIKAREALLNCVPEPTMVNGRLMRPASVANNGYHWIDELIKRWLNGYRKGPYVCWDLGDGYEYLYEPVTHRLGRQKIG